MFLHHLSKYKKRNLKLSQINMIVISKKSTTKIVKGLRYEVEALYNSPGERRPRVYIKNFGAYAINNFTDTDGNELPKIDIPFTRSRFESLRFEDLQKGDILVCNTGHYKTLVKDGMYRIEELSSKSKIITGWQGRQSTQVTEFVKFVGIKRKLQFNGYSFRKLSTEEAREMSLNKVLYDEEEKVISSTEVRKVDLLQNKNKELISYLAKSIIDPNRHQLSTLDWTIETKKRWIDLIPQDFEEVLNMNFREVLQLIDQE